METRQTIEYRVFILNLSEMHGGVDKSHAVAAFDDIEKLKSYYNSQLADAPYEDTPSGDASGNVHAWYKVFKKGSPLEWYNPLSPINTSGDMFSVTTYQNAGFGAVTEEWWNVYPSSENCKVIFNPS